MRMIYSATRSSGSNNVYKGHNVSMSRFMAVYPFIKAAYHKK
nr:MAG TPA: hypothetical protein [Caudoviricetes sp.]